MNTVKLGDICEVTAGQSAPQDSGAFGSTGKPFIRAGSLGDLVLGGSEESCEMIPDASAKRLRIRLFPKDTILFAKSGMSATLGRVYRLRNPAYVVSHLAAVIPGDRVEPSYLQRWFERNPPSRLIPNKAYPSIRTSEIANLKIDLPCLTEQKRIAAILDKADAIRRKRLQAIQLADEFLRSVFLDIFGDPINNSRNWDVVSFEKVCLKITDGEHQNPKFMPSGAPMVMAGNVLNEGVSFSDIKYISAEDNVRFRRKCDPERGDLLIVSRGATIGRITLVDTDVKFSLMGSVILAKPAKDIINPRYLLLLLSHPGYQARLYRTSSASAQQAIYLTHLKELPIPLPPREMQLEFANIHTKTKESIARYAHQKTEGEELFNSLSQRAFQGRL